MNFVPEMTVKWLTAVEHQQFLIPGEDGQVYLLTEQLF